MQVPTIKERDTFITQFNAWSAKMHLSVLQLAYVVVLFWKAVVATHFRGGTINWKPTGNETEVYAEYMEIKTKLVIYF